MINQHIEAGKDVKEKCLTMEEQCLDFEMKNEDQEAEQIEQVQTNEYRRIAVDEKRVELKESLFAVNGEDRSGMLAEREEVLSVLSALVKSYSKVCMMKLGPVFFDFFVKPPLPPPYNFITLIFSACAGSGKKIRVLEVRWLQPAGEEVRQPDKKRLLE